MLDRRLIYISTQSNVFILIHSNYRIGTNKGISQHFVFALLDLHQFDCPRRSGVFFKCIFKVSLICCCETQFLITMILNSGRQFEKFANILQSKCVILILPTRTTQNHQFFQKKERTGFMNY